MKYDESVELALMDVLTSTVGARPDMPGAARRFFEQEALLFTGDRDGFVEHVAGDGDACGGDGFAGAGTTGTPAFCTRHLDDLRVQGEVRGELNAHERVPRGCEPHGVRRVMWLRPEQPAVAAGLRSERL